MYQCDIAAVVDTEIHCGANVLPRSHCDKQNKIKQIMHVKNLCNLFD